MWLNQIIASLMYDFYGRDQLAKQVTDALTLDFDQLREKDITFLNYLKVCFLSIGERGTERWVKRERRKGVIECTRGHRK